MTDTAMTSQDVLDVFRQAGAYLEGHFILTSGLRSPIFLQRRASSCMPT